MSRHFCHKALESICLGEYLFILKLWLIWAFTRLGLYLSDEEREYFSHALTKRELSIGAKALMWVIRQDC